MGRFFANETAIPRRSEAAISDEPLAPAIYSADINDESLTRFHVLITVISQIFSQLSTFLGLALIVLREERGLSLIPSVSWISYNIFRKF